MEIHYNNGDTVSRSVIANMIMKSTSDAEYGREISRILRVEALERLKTAKNLKCLAWPTLGFAHRIKFDDDVKDFSFYVCNDGYGCEWMTLKLS